MRTGLIRRGHDVYLTIDINLQKKIYNALEDEIILDIIIHTMRNGSIQNIRNNSNGECRYSIYTCKRSIFCPYR